MFQGVNLEGLGRLKRRRFVFSPFVNVHWATWSRGARQGRRPREIQVSAGMKRAFIEKWQIELISTRADLKCKYVICLKKQNKKKVVENLLLATISYAANCSVFN